MRQFLPIEVPWKSGDAIVAFLVAWIGAPIAIVYALKLLAPSVPLLQSFLISFKAGDLTSSFVFAAVNALATLAVVAYYLRRYKVGWREVGWRKFNVLKAILFVIGAIVLFMVAVEAAFFVVTFLFPTFNASQAQTNEFTKPSTSTARQLSLIALVVMPPIVEETIFRGFIFPALSKWRGALVGAVLTSLLFGFAHLQLNVSLYTVILSLILCYMYTRLRSIWPGVILHMVNNYIAYMTLIKK